jgi:predicted Fe-Mo cluster-binding NifX family protein
MDLLVAFGTDDGVHLNDDHVGMAKEYLVYRFTTEGEKLIGRRPNSSYAGDETAKHGDPEKAKATSSVLYGVDVLVGKKFGPNITRLLTKFVCVVMRSDDVSVAIEAVRANMDAIVREMDNGPERKHLVLRGVA